MDTIKLYDPTYMSQTKLRRSGKNSESTQRENRALVLRIIADCGPISRLTLARRTGLQHATVTIIIKDLLQNGMIETCGPVEGDKGRRVMSFCLTNQFCSICVRITSTYIKVGLYDLRLNNLFIHKEFMDTTQDVRFTLGKIQEAIQQAKLSCGSRILLGVCVGVEGRCHISDDDYCLWDKKTNAPILVGKTLHDALKLPITVNRAINFSAYYTWHQQYKQELGTLLQVNIGYAIECGIIINGEILNGRDGQAGMLGRIRVSSENDKTTEDILSTPVVLAEARSLLPEYPGSYIADKQEALNIRDVVHGFDIGDPLCLRVFQNLANRLASVLTPMIHLLAPSYISTADETPTSDIFEKMVRDAITPLVGEDNATVVHTYTPGLTRESRNDPALLGGALYLLHAAIDYPASPVYERDGEG